MNERPLTPLTARQREHLRELANIRDNGNTGQAFFYPTGSEFRTANALARRGLLKSSASFRCYELTDAGYEEARRA